MRYAQVQDVDGLVLIVIVYDGSAAYDPGEGISLVQVPDDVPCAEGYTYANGVFTPPA